MPQVIQDGAEVCGVPVDQVGSCLVLEEHIKGWYQIRITEELATCNQTPVLMESLWEVERESSNNKRIVWMEDLQRDQAEIWKAKLLKINIVY